MQITAKSRRGQLRPPRPTFVANASPDHPRQCRDSNSKSARNPPAPLPLATLPQPLMPGLSQAAPGNSQGTQGMQNTSPGTLEGQASRPLSTPPTFPRGRDSPHTPTQEIGNTNSLGDRVRRRGTSGAVKVLHAHDSPDRPSVEALAPRVTRSRSLLRRTSRGKSSKRGSVVASSTMSDTSTDTTTAAMVHAVAAAQATAANAAGSGRPAIRLWLPCITAPRTVDEGGSESIQNCTAATTSTVSRSHHSGQKGSTASSNRQVGTSGSGQVSLFKWGLRMSCL